MSLIINADDLGYDPAVTRGIVEAMTAGIVTSTTLMVNGPHAEDAAKAVKGLSLAIGLHLNLARWAPCAHIARALLGADGTFDEAKVSRLPSQMVEVETVAQLDRLKALTGRGASHLDVHKHLHRHQNVLEGVIRAAQARQLPVRSVDASMRVQLKSRGIATNDELLGDTGETAYWTTERLSTVIRGLPSSGVIELMCHPGYTPLVTQSGYSTQREVELHAFISNEARDALDARAVSPTSWWSLHL